MAWRGAPSRRAEPPRDLAKRAIRASGGGTLRPCVRERSTRVKSSPPYDARSTRDVSRGTPGLAPRRRLRRRRTAILTSKSAAESRAGTTPHRDGPACRAARTHVSRNIRGAACSPTRESPCTEPSRAESNKPSSLHRRARATAPITFVKYACAYAHGILTLVRVL